MMMKTVYMLHDGEGSFAGGPYCGEPGLDFSALMSEFRELRYAQAEAAREDVCYISESDFEEWLLKKGVLTPMAAQQISIDLDTSGKGRYVPKHWPLCPECEVGRGSDTPGDVKEGLNRWVWFFKCVECGHAWGAYEVPYNSKKPMIDDDGRSTPGGCAPYSISQAGGLPIEKVMTVCARHGWREDSGMTEHDGLLAARELGVHLVPGDVRMVAGKPTLRRFLNSIRSTASYIVATRGHWLAVVKGENHDQSYTSMRAEVIGYWEVRANSGGQLGTDI